MATIKKNEALYKDVVAVNDTGDLWDLIHSLRTSVSVGEHVGVLLPPKRCLHFYSTDAPSGFYISKVDRPPFEVDGETIYPPDFVLRMSRDEIVTFYTFDMMRPEYGHAWCSVSLRLRTIVFMRITEEEPRKGKQRSSIVKTLTKFWAWVRGYDARG